MLFASNIVESFAFPSLSSCYAIPLATTVPLGIKASKKLSIIEIARVILPAIRNGCGELMVLSLIVDIHSLAMSTIDDNS